MIMPVRLKDTEDTRLEFTVQVAVEVEDTPARKAAVAQVKKALTEKGPATACVMFAAMDGLIRAVGLAEDFKGDIGAALSWAREQTEAVSAGLPSDQAALLGLLVHAYDMAMAAEDNGGRDVDEEAN